MKMASSAERGTTFPCFKGKVVVITGASSGIGEATAIEFAKDGAKLALTGRNAERLNGTAQKCINEGIPAENVLQLTGELADESFIERIINETVSKLGGIDVLVNNAGTTEMSTVGEYDREKLDRALDMFVRSVLLSIRRAVPHLKKTKGSVVNVSSSFGSVVGNYSCVEYCLAKGALNHMSVNLAYELAQDGVRINTVSPGATLTPIFDLMSGPEGQKMMKVESDKSGFKRAAQPHEVATTIQFLASSAASYVTGIDLLVDGGQTKVPFVLPEQLQ